MELRNPDGTVIERLGFLSGPVSLHEENFYDKSSPIFLAQQNFEADHAGNEIDTNLLQVEGGHLKLLKAIDSQTNQMDDILLIHGGGAFNQGEWKLAPSKTDKNVDILTKFNRCLQGCSGAAEQPNQKFQVEYSRYHFDGRQWVVHEKIVPESAEGTQSGDEYPD